MIGRQRNFEGKVTSKRRYLLLPGLLLLLSAGGISCSRQNESAPEPEASVKTESKVLLPSYLEALEQEAEEVLVLADKEEWPKVAQKIDTISATWKEYLPQVPAPESGSEKIEAVQQRIETLRADAQQKERMGTMQAANDLSGAVLDLYELYNPAVPVGLERLDTAERQVLLDMESGKAEKAKVAVEKSQGYWDQLKSAVTYRGGEDLAEKFQVSLALQRDYVDSGKQDLLSAEVQNSLEIIDMIEGLF